MQKTETIDERLANVLYAIVPGRSDDMATWVKHQRLVERRNCLPRGALKPTQCMVKDFTA